MSEEIMKCTECGTTEAKKITRYSHHNGICGVVTDFCPKCERKHAPPKSQFKMHGGTIRQFPLKRSLQ